VPITTRSAGGGFVPTDIAGLRVWLDPSDAGSITEAAGLVSQWDSLVNSYNAAQGTGSSQPTTGSVTINSLNALAFDGSDVLTLSDTASTIMGASAAGTVLFVTKRNSDTGDAVPNAAISDWGTDGGNQDYEPYNDGTIYHGWGSNTRKTTGNPSADLSAVHLFTIITSASEWTYKIDGTNHYTTGTNTVAWSSSAPRLCVANGASNAARHLGEILMYDTALTGTDLTNAQDYLSTKWGTP
jgi:hypothetical protein